MIQAARFHIGICDIDNGHKRATPFVCDPAGRVRRVNVLYRGELPLACPKGAWRNRIGQLLLYIYTNYICTTQAGDTGFNPVFRALSQLVAHSFSQWWTSNYHGLFGCSSPRPCACQALKVIGDNHIESGWTCVT